MIIVYRRKHLVLYMLSKSLLKESAGIKSKQCKNNKWVECYLKKKKKSLFVNVSQGFLRCKAFNFTIVKFPRKCSIHKPFAIQWSLNSSQNDMTDYHRQILLVVLVVFYCKLNNSSWFHFNNWQLSGNKSYITVLSLNKV